MARVLMGFTPMAGHVLPALPVARELVAAGHQVVWYCGRRFEQPIRGTGAEFRPIPAHLEFDEQTDTRPGQADPDAGLAGFKRIIMRLIVEPIPEYVRDVAPLVAQLRPDVLVSDHSFLALPILATRHGLRSVMLMSGPLHVSSADTAPFGTGLPPSSTPVGRLRNRILHQLMTAVMFRDVQRAMRRSAEAVGMSTGGAFFMDWGARLADRYLVTTVPEFEYPRSDLPQAVEFVGPVLPSDPAGWTPPAWWPDLEAARSASRRVVFVVQGAPADHPRDLVVPTVEALAGEDVLVVAATSAVAPDDVLPSARRPDNLRIEQTVSLSEMLPMADVVVTNGTYGTVQAPLTHGVPVVAVRLGGDETEAVARVRWSGAGVALGAPAQAKIRAAVWEVLAQPHYREAAERLGKAYARYSGVRQATAAILA